MKDRRRVVVLLDVPADLRPTLGRLLKALGRRFNIRAIDYAELPDSDKRRLADLVKPAPETAADPATR